MSQHVIEKINGKIISWSQTKKYLKLLFIDFYAAVTTEQNKTERKADKHKATNTVKSKAHSKRARL